MESLNNSSTLSLSLFQSLVNENPKTPQNYKKQDNKNPWPPSDLIDYRKMRKFEQFKISEKFHQQEHIKEYLEAKWKAELHNRDTFMYLWDLHKTDQDEKKLHALEVKLSQFKRVIMAQEKPYPVLKLDFINYPMG